MKPRSQRGQALPAVLAIMLVLVLLAGGATMAVSAVLRQQDANRAITTADVSSQNAAAATAANVAGGQSACNPAANAGAPDNLLQYDFKSSKIGIWHFIAGSAVVQPNGLMLAPSSIIVPDFSNPSYPNVVGAEKWSDYSVSAQVRATSMSGIGPELDAYSHQNKNGNSLTSYYFLQLRDKDVWTFGMKTLGKNGVKTSIFPSGPTSPKKLLEANRWARLSAW